MILVLCGTNPYSFERLVKAVDILALELDTKILIQLGNTEYKPQNCEYFDFIERKQLTQYMKNADFIITQGGFGSISECLTLGKKIIAVPRRVELNECVDNQDELVKFLEQKKLLVGVYDCEKLLEGIFRLNSVKKYKKKYNHVAEYISEYINNFF
ncbi:glycosyltransferase [Niallia alba]|uniref:glycosyltransferase n=1 Tax=Niallia alba TaxID=2729105 RepID=UPI00399FA4EB